MSFLKTIFSFVLMLAVQYSVAQTSGIKATVDKNKILIGEPIELTVEVTLPANETIKFIAIDSILHFELLEKPVIDTASSDNGTSIKGVYKITSFDSGHWVIPSFVFSESVKTDTIPIDVVFADFDPSQEYHGIKDIIEVQPKEENKPWWWYVAGGVLVLAILLYFLLRKKKPTAVAVPKVIGNAFEEAMKELEKLKKEKPESKLFHSRLTDIFRLYIFRKKGILSLQKTTDDLIVQLKGLNLDKNQFDKLSQALRLSDFVKFAKYIPASEDDAIALESIKESIIVIEKSV